jgi:hypothetical protein
LKSLISAALGKPALELWSPPAPAELQAAMLRVAMSLARNDQLICGHFCFSRDGRVLDERSVPGLRLLVLTRHPFDRFISQLAAEKAMGGNYGDYPYPNIPPQQLARELLLGQWDGKPLPNGQVTHDFAAGHNFHLRDLVTEWLIHRNCLLVKFEDLVSRPVDILVDCLSFIGVALPRAEILKITETINFMTLSGGRSPGQLDATSHYRKGTVGEWRQLFSAGDIEILRQKYGDEFTQIGYSL